MLLKRINPDPTQGCDTGVLLAFNTRCPAPARTHALTHTENQDRWPRFSFSPVLLSAKDESAAAATPVAEHGPMAPPTPATPRLGENPPLLRADPAAPSWGCQPAPPSSAAPAPPAPPSSSSGKALAAQTSSGCTTPGHKPQTEQATPPPGVGHCHKRKTYTKYFWSNPALRPTLGSGLTPNAQGCPVPRQPLRVFDGRSWQIRRQQKNGLVVEAD